MLNANQARELVAQSTDFDFRKERLLSQILTDIKGYASYGQTNYTALETNGIVTKLVVKELRKLGYTVLTSKLNYYDDMKHNRIFISWAHNKVKLADVHISKKFSQYIPSPNKLQKHYELYLENGYFKDTIVLNRLDGTLLDGYCVYLVAKMFNIKEVEVTYKVVHHE